MRGLSSTRHVNVVDDENAGVRGGVRKKSTTLRSKRGVQKKSQLKKEGPSVAVKVVDAAAANAAAAAAAANEVLLAKLEVERKRATQQRQEFQSLLASQIDGLRALKAERADAIAALAHLAVERSESEAALRAQLRESEADAASCRAASSAAAADAAALRVALAALGPSCGLAEPQDDGRRGCDVRLLLFDEVCAMAAEDTAATLRRQEERYAVATRRRSAATERRLDALQAKQRTLLSLAQRERDAALEHERELRRVAIESAGSDIGKARRVER